MNRARHFAHALVGLILIAGIGAFLAHQAAAPARAARSPHHVGGGQLAVAGLLIVLALFVVVSLYCAVKGGGRSQAPKRPGLPYAALGRRK